VIFRKSFGTSPVVGEKEKVEEHSLQYSCGEGNIPSPFKIDFSYINHFDTFLIYLLAAGLWFSFVTVICSCLQSGFFVCWLCTAVS